MPRVNVYVPDEMKARMDAAGEAANWSAAAQRAFESELRHIETVKEIASMDDVIARLRASKENYQAEEGQGGKANGMHWARQRAGYRELLAMSKVDSAVIWDMGQGDDAATWLYGQVFSDDEASFENVAIFLGIEPEHLSGVSVEFVDAFIEGASDVWNEVADKI